MKAHSDTFLRSSFNKPKDSDMPHTGRNNETSFKRIILLMIPNFQEDHWSLMYFKKNGGPNIDHWGKPASTGAPLEC